VGEAAAHVTPSTIVSMQPGGAVARRTSECEVAWIPCVFGPIDDASKNLVPITYHLFVGVVALSNGGSAKIAITASLITLATAHPYLPIPGNLACLFTLTFS